MWREGCQPCGLAMAGQLGAAGGAKGEVHGANAGNQTARPIREGGPGWIFGGAVAPKIRGSLNMAAAGGQAAGLGQGIRTAELAAIEAKLRRRGHRVYSDVVERFGLRTNICKSQTAFTSRRGTRLVAKPLR